MARVIGDRGKGIDPLFPESLEFVFPDQGCWIRPSAWFLEDVSLGSFLLRDKHAQTGLSIEGDLLAHVTENARAWLPSRMAWPWALDNCARPAFLPPLACALLCGGFIPEQAPQALPEGPPSQSQLQDDLLSLAMPLKRAACLVPCHF